VDYDFRWIEWDLEHATCHGVSVSEIEGAVRSARAPFPEVVGDDKWLVVGRGSGGRWIQVIFIFDDDGTVFPIHARPLSDREKRRYRRRSR
jgi:uncharacterized DUF497 family protein